MTGISEQQLDQRYRNSPAYRAGHLPKSRRHLDQWHRDFKSRLAGDCGDQSPSSDAVDRLGDLIQRDGIVRMYVLQMLDQQPEGSAVTDVSGLLAALRHIVTRAPQYDPDPASHATFPMSHLFAYMMTTPAGEVLFRLPSFNAALTEVLKEWCVYLDSPASAGVLNEGPTGWLCPSAAARNRLWEYEYDASKPHWGWTSYNDFFHRQIDLNRRPVDGLDDPAVIVAANDGTLFNIGENAQASSPFWLKGQLYSLQDMLDGSHVTDFIGGTVFQSFLSGANYHRWASPVAGTIVEARVVTALTFSDAESEGPDPTAGTYSQFYETAVNTRGLVFIRSDNPNIGLVCVIPIGITEVSSVQIEVKEGDRVEKGGALGRFSYGGSAMALVFQPSAIDRFTVPYRPSGGDPDSGPPIRVRQQIALART
jgi:phosphatidylserine decarboxylase